MKAKKIRFGKSFTIVTLMSAFLVSTFPTQSSAYLTHGGKWSSPDMLTYWIDSSVAFIGFTSASDHGGVAWNSSPCVWFSKQNSATGAHIRILW